MQRTHISLTDGERRALDTEAARTGKSISALIRDAVESHYGTQSEDRGGFRVDAEGVRRMGGRGGTDAATWVEGLRSGGRPAREDT